MNKNKFELDFFGGYALALASMALAALARWLLPEALAPAPYLGFYPAVVVSAALGGAGPGLMATFGSLILVNFVFGHFDIHDHGMVARQVIWVVASVGVSLLAGTQRKARAAEFERRMVENALGLTEDRLSMALDSGRMGTWDWDVATNEIIWSPMFREIFGIANDEPPSVRLFLERLHPQDRDAVDTLCRRCLDPKIRAPFDAQFRVVWPNGGVHWVLGRGKAYFEDARSIRFIGITIDVSEQKEAEAHLRVMVDELSHRVKNTLAVVQSITAQTFRGRNEISGIRESLEGRLQSLADTHTLLTLSHWESVDLASLVEKSVGHLGKVGDPHFSMSGPELGLTAKAALALGLALHELSVNAAKYGAWSTEQGAVALDWGVSGDSIEMEWIESGLKDLTPPARKGFGSRLMTQAIEYDLEGEATQIWRPEGLRYALTIPLANALASTEGAST
jgi:PAS domain S-box-containing protein